jgi:hypothetical protein
MRIFQTLVEKDAPLTDDDLAAAACADVTLTGKLKTSSVSGVGVQKR